MKKLVDYNSIISIPKSKQFAQLAIELDSFIRINRYSKTLHETLLHFLVFRYRRGLTLQQWKLMLDELQKLYSIGEDRLIEEINIHTMRSDFVLISPEFKDKALYEIESKGNKRSGIKF